MFSNHLEVKTMDDIFNITEEKSKPFVGHIPEYIKYILQASKGKAFIAGSYALKLFDLSNPIDFDADDVDFWMMNNDMESIAFKAMWKEIHDQGYKKSKRYQDVIQFEHAFNKKIQLIFPWYGKKYTTPFDVIKGFDLTQCQVGFDQDTFYWTSDCEYAIKKRMQFCKAENVEHIRRTGQRIMKYDKRGFKGEEALDQLFAYASLHPEKISQSSIHYMHKSAF